MRLTLTLIALTFWAVPAAAQLRFCNETDARVSVAVGYKRDGAWVSEGWWGLAPAECKTALGGALANRHYYYRVTSADLTFPGESYYFCTDSRPFDIVGDEACQARGFRREEFAGLDVGEARSYTLTLTVPVPTGPEPGTNGEPYSITGVLSHCDVTDSTLQCELHADGWRYVVSSAGPTPMALLEEMLNMAPNTPMHWAGDMISYSDPTAEVTLRDMTPSGADPYADLRAALQGFWRSADDATYEVLISGGIFEEMSGGIPTDTAVMQLADTCDGAMGDGPYIRLNSFNGPEYDRCHAVVSVTGGALVVFPIGTMNDLVFDRVN